MVNEVLPPSAVDEQFPREGLRWFTCTPRDFDGGPGFFCRDSGLMCRAFQALGVESRAVMISECRPDDEPDLIRVSMAELESAAWWRGHGLDGVVLYAWGSPRFRRVARAIHEAGVRLVLNQDNSGWISPLVGLSGWLAEQRLLAGAGVVAGGWLRFITLVGKGLTLGLLRTDPLRAVHLRCGDRIACVSPQAVDLYRELCLIYGGRHLASRVALLPHPVGPGFVPDGGGKQRRIVTVGRWDDVIQKRPGRLMEVMDLTLRADPELEWDVVGSPVEIFSDWQSDLPGEMGRRVTLHGAVAHPRLVQLLQRARVSYCPSAYESFHIASGEALCCGCSLVAADSPSLAACRWFVADGDGTLAVTDTADGHADALMAEMKAWDEGTRNAVAIASRWGGRLHAPRVAARVLEWFSGEGPR